MCWWKVLTFQSSHQQKGHTRRLNERVHVKVFAYSLFPFLIRWWIFISPVSSTNLLCSWCLDILRLFCSSIQRLTPSVWNGVAFRWHQTHVAGVDVLPHEHMIKLLPLLRLLGGFGVVLVMLVFLLLDWFASHQTAHSLFSSWHAAWEAWWWNLWTEKVITIFISETIFHWNILFWLLLV